LELLCFPKQMDCHFSVPQFTGFLFKCLMEFIVAICLL
jgi:hypothetical protein